MGIGSSRHLCKRLALAWFQKTLKPRGRLSTIAKLRDRSLLVSLTVQPGLIFMSFLSKMPYTARKAYGGFQKN